MIEGVDLQAKKSQMQSLFFLSTRFLSDWCLVHNLAQHQPVSGDEADSAALAVGGIVGAAGAVTTLLEG